MGAVALVYPYPHVDDVVPLMAEGRLPYLACRAAREPRILKLMKRPASAENNLERVRPRSICPS